MNEIILEENLRKILENIRQQDHLAPLFPKERLNFVDQMNSIDEFIEVGEYGLAYENIISLLEVYSFVLHGVNAVKLLEVGLFFGFKYQ
ncbi:hypothetical protein AVKW3434_23745 [Acidovorax sp. SUPP3434]|uniref:hypothetical protein n=1 Tax=Acidovorax sp. SUPP3434 TaxID=2920880 RepID=UPI0023DE374F|nr:hypothetical protein [Acidovorax sp. SUPP3434]GKT02460.1 hypothetical protein AVKW3434_23745 [Acidovorax sp. SUPP3434]